MLVRIQIPHGIKRICGLLVICLCAFTTRGAGEEADAPKPSLPLLTTAAQVRRLSAGEANRHYPVLLRGVVTFSDRGGFFIQASSEAVAVNAPKSPVHPGQFVELEGTTECPDFAPQILSTRLSILGSATLPKPLKATFEEMASTVLDSQWVEIAGIVHSETSDEGNPALEVAIPGGRVLARIPSLPPGMGAKLIDAKVAIRGNSGAIYNDRNQWVGARLYVPDMSAVRVETPALADPFLLPVLTVSGLHRFNLGKDSGHRARVQGVVTFAAPGQFVVGDDAEGILVFTHQNTTTRPGDRVDVVGFPGVGQYTGVLDYGSFRVLSSGNPLEPKLVTPEEIMKGSRDAALVRVEGTLLGHAPHENWEILSMRAGDQSFDAEILVAGAKKKLDSLREGSLLQLTGVCLIQADEAHLPQGFRLLLRAPADIVILEQPSWWTIPRLVGMLGVMAFVILAVSSWVASLRKQVKKQTEIIRTTLESTGDGVLVVNLKGKILAYNRNYVEVDRIPESLLRNGDHRQVLKAARAQWKDPEAVLARVSGIYADREAHSDDLLECADGRIFERHSEPLRVGGKSIGRVWVFRDITIRKRAEQALRKSESRFRRLAESNMLGVTIGDRTGRLTYTNDAFLNIVGYTREDFEAGRVRWDVMTPPDQRHIPENIIKQLSTTGVAEPLETVHLHKDGRRVPVLLGLAQLEGDENEAVAFIIDLTERKRFEEELHKAKDVAEAANRAKSEFLANMSHEIRTPMNGIIGMAELALDTELAPEQREYIGMVKTSADSLLTVINDILDFSKIEAGRFDLEFIEFDLASAFTDTSKALALRAHQKGLELISQVEPGVPAIVRGDPTRLRQVLINLIGNAIKFTDHGEVSASLNVESQGSGEIVLHFAVADTGIGIPQNRQRLIFEAFTQADTSMTRKFGGTGLGLTISSQLVKMMGGRIWVESEPGKGSTFHFTVRLGLPSIGTVKATPATHESLRHLRVLVVDDNATNRRILEGTLKNWEMVPLLAEGGQAALAALHEARRAGKPFPVVLTDAHMPEMDGFTLAERIRQDPELAGAVIMMLTSGGQRGDAERCRNLGISAYLTKPVGQSELLDALRMTLGERAAQAHPPRLITRHFVRESRRQVNILLAEDNAVSRELAIRLLEKRGHKVRTVTSGEEAVSLVQSLPPEELDIVLMDVQMPVMDGFQATALIREKERAGARHIPIVAMTAHALKGDRERCLEAGMDAYVTKPIEPKELFDTIDSLVPEKRRSVQEETTAPDPAHILDEAVLLKRVGGDTGLLRDLVDLFQQESPRLLSEIEKALERQDAKALEGAAHTLKGSAGNLAAKGVYEAALKLERIARSEDLSSAGAALDWLKDELARLSPILAKLGVEVA